MKDQHTHTSALPSGQGNTRHTPAKLTRRTLIRSVGTGALAVAGAGLFGGSPPAFAQPRSLHVVQWSHFIPPADQELARQAAEFEKQSGIRVQIEHINLNDITARATAAVESGIGADIFELQWNQAHLFASGLDNHDDLIEAIWGSEDKIYSFIKAANKVNGVWRGIPHFTIGWMPTYRKDLFHEAGAQIPETYEDYLREGKKLKDHGYPVGQTLGHTIGDAPFFAYAVMWSFGGMEVDANQKVVINSKQTLESIEWLKEFWFAACDEGGLAWDDSSNNRAYLAETVSVTGNAISIYFKAKNSSDPRMQNIAKNTGHFLPPRGPAGRYFMSQPYNYNITAHSKRKREAREFLKFIMQKDNYTKWFRTNAGFALGPTPEWENDPMWEEDPAVTVFRTAAGGERWMGYSGPNDRKASEVQARYIIVDMYARTVRGDKPAEALKWAERELKQVYEL